MKNQRITGDNLKLTVLFIVIAVSFAFLIRGVYYKNILILVLVVVSVYFGFVLKKRRYRQEEEAPQEIPEVPSPSIELKSQKNIPDEFKKEQERFQNLYDKKSVNKIKSKEEKMEEDTAQTQESPEGEEKTAEETRKEKKPEENSDKEKEDAE